MKIKDITEYGFYKILLPIDSIAEALKDEDENGNEILSIMLWSWMDTIDGIKFYQTDMVALNPDNDDIRIFGGIEHKRAERYVSSDFPMWVPPLN